MRAIQLTSALTLQADARYQLDGPHSVGHDN